MGASGRCACCCSCRSCVADSFASSSRSPSARSRAQAPAISNSAARPAVPARRHRAHPGPSGMPPPVCWMLARKILARSTCDSQELRLGGRHDMRPSAVNRWVLLIHQIPPKPDYFRVKVWRRLQRVGAVAIKNSVYVLPRSDETVEDFQWQMREIVAGGGEASVCEASFVDGLSDAEVEALFRAARDADYGEVVADAQRLLKATPTRGGRRAPTEGRGSIEAEIGRLKRRLAGVVAIDFFGAPSRQVAHEELGRLEMRLRPSGDAIPPPPTPPAPAPRGATWVTRLGVHVDRIASAWLIRRFIDPKAQFKFVAPDGYRPRPGELRFDMFEAEYTHEGDACTFETLVARFGLGDPAVRVIAQIVHDIDCKEAKFGRPETPGIERLIAGIAQQHQEDSARVDLGAALFDALYAALTGTAGDTSRRATKRRGARKRSKPSPR